MWDRRTPDSGMNYLDRFGYSYSYASSKINYEVFFAEGMAFAIKREVINKVGVFDDYFFMEYDDMDLSWRARLGGYKVFFVPKAIVYHARGGTVGATYFQRINNVTWYTRNHLVTLIKNYEIETLLKLSPIILTVEMIKIVYLANSKEKLENIICSIKGYSASYDRSQGYFTEKGRKLQVLGPFLIKKSFRLCIHLILGFSGCFLKNNLRRSDSYYILILQ